MGYGYEFNIVIGASLRYKVVYRVEFKNTLLPEAPPSPTDPVGGGNDLLGQLTGGTETLKVTRVHAAHSDFDSAVLGQSLAVLPNNHGPQTDRLVYGLGPFEGYDSGDATSRDIGLYDQRFVDTCSHSLSNGGAGNGRP